MLASRRRIAEVVELPVLVAVASPPLPRRIAALVLEPDGDAVLGEAPELLAQPVVELLRPLAGEEVDDGLAALKELVAVPPYGVRRVGERNPFGVAHVPRVLGGLHLLAGGLLGERRGRRPRVHRRRILVSALQCPHERRTDHLGG